jgi:hypothetical protein
VAVRGRNGLYFLPVGSDALRRDNPHVEVHLLDTGHLAPETRVEEIVSAMRRHLATTVPADQ